MRIPKSYLRSQIGSKSLVKNFAPGNALVKNSHYGVKKKHCELKGCGLIAVSEASPGTAPPDLPGRSPRPGPEFHGTGCSKIALTVKRVSGERPAMYDDNISCCNFTNT